MHRILARSSVCDAYAGDMSLMLNVMQCTRIHVYPNTEPNIDYNLYEYIETDYISWLICMCGVCVRLEIGSIFISLTQSRSCDRAIFGQTDCDFRSARASDVCSVFDLI